MKLWAGRFEQGTEEIVDDFHASISVDKRLYKQDIEGSMAHARMLARQGIITKADADAITEGLAGILQEMQEGKIAFPASCEDIHMLVETLLTQRIGEAGKRLHTGRSRNDQVALDMRMYAMEACKETSAALRELCETLLDMAAKHASDVMPGYTHLQHAQPVTLGHHLMAYFEMFLRDMGRVLFAGQSADSMPLGSGALAGTTYPLDRPYVARELHFSQITRNSLDAVSDRDFLLDYLYAASAGMMHLSRFCEELVLWSSQEFRFIMLSDGYATGSSMMPQKKNPDVAELIRGKTGRVYGDLTGLLTVIKGMPLSYGKDMQEDKESFFDAYDTYLHCLRIFTPMLRTAVMNIQRMRASAALGFSNATDCADYLVRKGVPFRDAHAITGRLVAACISKDCGLGDLDLEALKSHCPAFESDVYDALSLDACVSARDLPGGPAPARVLEAVEEGRRLIDTIGRG